jgi:hypothetical protein
MDISNYSIEENKDYETQNKELLEKVKWEYTHFFENTRCRSKDAIFSISSEITYRILINSCLKEYLLQHEIENASAFLGKDDISDELYNILKPSIMKILEVNKIEIIKHILPLYFDESQK